MAIEKGRLIDILNQPTKGFTPMAGEPIPSYSLVGKDKKLLSLPNELSPHKQANRCALTTQYGAARAGGQGAILNLSRKNIRSICSKGIDVWVERYRCFAQNI